MLRFVTAVVITSCLATGSVLAQPPSEAAKRTGAKLPADADAVKTGFLIDVPMPLTSRAAENLVAQLATIGESAPAGQRTTVVLRYGDGERGGDAGGSDASPSDPSETAFEDSLRLARAMSSNELRQVRVVSWVQGTVAGHLTLPILASDLLLVSATAEIMDASAGDSSADETIGLLYQSIARRRGLFPSPVVAALVDPGLELALVSKVAGDQVFASGSELDQMRADGELIGEEIYSPPGAALRLSGKQLRSARIAAAVVASPEQAAEFLDLARLNSSDDPGFAGEAKGILLEITGSIAPGRTRRWQSNLDSTLSDSVIGGGDGTGINTWMISIDSIGGNLDDSATLAGWFATPQPPLRTVAGLVRGEARGDAALIAMACKPLYVKPDARLGGPGAESIDRQQLMRYDELIEQIATNTKRPAALIRGLLDPELKVYRYTNRKTGRVRYATEDDIVAGFGSARDADVERDKWQRGQRIELADGVTATQAVTLGLADAESNSLEEASRRVGLSGTPPPVSDRGLVRLVERLGRNPTLSFLLLFIGFAALSAEANAPGLSFPGFIALVCFGLFFWMKFLAGTAEWLELVALTLGLICIAIELFIVPGMGVFGIGGLALTVLGIVLMSQTFVIPKNVYQLTLLSRGIWAALGGAAGMVGGFIAIRMMLPHVPLLRGLVMETGDVAAIEESEKLGDYAYLLGQTGTATTPLRPSGKAQFGDEVVAVVSDGTSIGVGEPVRVCSVLATRVIVESVER